MKENKNIVRYAVVGLGYIAQSAILPSFKNAKKNSQLVALVSGNEEKLRVLGKKYRIKNCYLYSEFEQCLKSGEIDAIYIATPNDHHRSIMEIAAQYKVHVLCEKPMAVTVRDCESMIEVAKANNIKMMIGYRLHFEAANLDAIQSSKKIGDLKIFHSTFTMQVKDRKNIRLQEVDQGGGAIYDIGVYCINAARYLFKSEPIEVSATSLSSSDPRFKKVDEITNVILKFPENRIACFTVSFGAYDSSDYDLIGTKGRIRLENGYDYAMPMNLKIYKNNRMAQKKYLKRDQFAPELLYFSNCILKNKNPEPSGQEGLADIRVVEKIFQSLRIGAPIAMKQVPKANQPNNEQRITRPGIPKIDLVKAISPSGES
jgi:predicted dehydrogenase